MSPEQVAKHLTGDGFTLCLVSGDRLQVSPATKLSDNDRSLIRENKTALIDLLLKSANDSTMVAALHIKTQRGHQRADDWSEAEISNFTRRVVSIQAQGLDLSKAEVVAETLLKRDREADDRSMCVECLKLSRFTCTTHKATGLTTQDVRPIRFMLQRCDAFEERT